VARLNRYIKEATKLQDREAKRIVKSKQSKLVSIFDKKNWDMPKGFVGAIMNIIYKDEDISFTIADIGDASTAEKAGQKWFVDAVLMSDESITIYVNPKIEDLVRKYKDNRKDFEKSEFMKEFIQILSHELVHREQWKKSGGKLLSKRYTTDMPMRRYLSFPHELEAQAHDAATKLHRGEKAPELEIYKIFGIKHPVYKRFMKKVFQFREELKKRDETE
jgi:hypothetical protein